MSSIKRKDEIQKSVEETILDAVTKFRKDEPSFNPYDGSRQFTEEELAIDNKTAMSLWDMVKQKKPTDNPSLFQAPKTHDLELEQQKDPAVIPDVPNTSELPKPPKFEKLPPVVSSPAEDNDQQPTMAVGYESHQLPSEVPSPVFDFNSSRLVDLNSIQAKLYESDHLKIAQLRIEDLEREVDRLRLENDRLASASELFQKRSEENLSAKQEMEKKFTSNEERFAEERQSLKKHLEDRDGVIKELRDKIEDLESRLSNDIRKSRSRERELENRLELARMEKISLVGSKDEIILDLKRQVDQLNHEIGNYRRKAAEMNQTIEANQEQFRRTVRALRLALTNLEVNEQIGVRSKKAE